MRHIYLTLYYFRRPDSLVVEMTLSAKLEVTGSNPDRAKCLYDKYECLTPVMYNFVYPLPGYRWFKHLVAKSGTR